MAPRTAFAHQDITRDVSVSIMSLIPAFVAVGSLVGDMSLMAPDMLHMLPSGCLASFCGISTSLFLASRDMNLDCISRCFSFEVGYFMKPIRRLRTICSTGVFCARNVGVHRDEPGHQLLRFQLRPGGGDNPRALPAVIVMVSRTQK